MNVDESSDLAKLERLVARGEDGLSIVDIERRLDVSVPRRTLQYRLRRLVDAGRLERRGASRATLYRIPANAVSPASGLPPSIEPATSAPARPDEEAGPPLSSGAAELVRRVRRPIAARTPTGFDRRLLDDYVPNVSAWLGDEERERLAALGTVLPADQPAGTYARAILNRLLIDLSWNSSRLEGNTYTRLDTRRLIALGAEADGKTGHDTQMILNHKAAIEFLVDSAGEIGTNRHTVLNLHALLADNLMNDPDAPGRLRRIAVGIAGSAYHPLEVPQLVEEHFDTLLTKAGRIDDPFEQSFFLLVQLPYLQPFDDVNKRTSRLAANIPLVRRNLIPLSFVDLPRAGYTEAVLGVYEHRDVTLLKELFVWAYGRSAARYAAVRQPLGEPDPFRLRHRAALTEIVADVVRRTLGRRETMERVRAFAIANVADDELERFAEMVETELLGLHEGNIARHRLRPSEFGRWQSVWADRGSSRSPRSAADGEQTL